MNCSNLAILVLVFPLVCRPDDRVHDSAVAVNVLQFTSDQVQILRSQNERLLALRGDSKYHPYPRALAVAGEIPFLLSQLRLSILADDVWEFEDAFAGLAFVSDDKQTMENRIDWTGLSPRLSRASLKYSREWNEILRVKHMLALFCRAKKKIVSFECSPACVPPLGNTDALLTFLASFSSATYNVVPDLPWPDPTGGFWVRFHSNLGEEFTVVRMKEGFPVHRFIYVEAPGIDTVRCDLIAKAVKAEDSSKE